MFLRKDISCTRTWTSCCWQNLHKSSSRTWLHPETVTWRNVGKVQKFYGIGHKLTHIPVSFEDKLLWSCLMKLNGNDIVVINLMRCDSRWALSSLSNEFCPTTRYAVSRTEERQREELRKREEKIERWLDYCKHRTQGDIRSDCCLKLESYMY